MTKTTSLNTETLQLAAEVLKTIGHPVRLQIIELLCQSDALSVAQLQEELEIEQSLLSHHLLRMKVRGILYSKKEGRHMFYGIRLEQVTKILDCMRNCEINL